MPWFGSTPHPWPAEPLQGYLAQKKQCPARTLQKDSYLGSYVGPGGGAVAYERGTLVGPLMGMSWVGGAPGPWPADPIQG